MSSRHVRAALLTLAALSAAPAAAQHAGHEAHAAHGGSQSAPMAQPSEPGSAAFAAIAEIVAMLTADPRTDWSGVNIDALRTHLVDMDALVSGAIQRSEPVPGGLRMHIDSTGRAGAAALRMVPAHGPVLAEETGWQSEVTMGDEITWIVTGPGPEDETRIRALGFFGLMATGDHHRQHHLALARGEAAH